MATRERQTRPADDAVGFARTIHRVAGWCALGYALVNPVALFLRAQYAEPPLTQGETLARLDRMVHDLRTSIESFTFDDAQVVRVEQA